MKTFNKKLLLLTFVFFSTFSVAFAQAPAPSGYKFLAPVTDAGIADLNSTDLAKYIPAVVKLTIGLAAVLAFVMITYGGVLYSTSDAISGKSQGREYITNAIYGLLLVLGSYLILWTINPKTLEFNLAIPTPDIKAAPSAGGGGGGSAGGVGCTGACVYSYINSSGTEVKYRDCVSCANYDTFDLNFKTKTVDGKVVQINSTLGNNLEKIQDVLGPGAFTISESWPPTVNHKASGQYDGTSVDLSLSGPTAAKITSFISTADKNNVRAVYEVSSESQRSSYISAGVPASSIIVVSYITGEHFSIYMK